MFYSNVFSRLKKPKVFFVDSGRPTRFGTGLTHSMFGTRMTHPAAFPARKNGGRLRMQVEIRHNKETARQRPRVRLLEQQTVLDERQ